MDITDITEADLQDVIIAPIIFEEYKNQVTKRMENGQNIHILAIHASSVFQDFENFLTTQIDLIEDDIKLVLEEYNSSFVTYELDPGIYNYKDLAIALFNILQHEYPSSNSEILIRLDDITRKTK